MPAVHRPVPGPQGPTLAVRRRPAVGRGEREEGAGLGEDQALADGEAEVVVRPEDLTLTDSPGCPHGTVQDIAYS